MFIFKTMNDLNGYLAGVPRCKNNGFPERRTQERRNGLDWQDWTAMGTPIHTCAGSTRTEWTLEIEAQLEAVRFAHHHL